MFFFCGGGCGGPGGGGEVGLRFEGQLPGLGMVTWVVTRYGLGLERYSFFRQFVVGMQT